MVIRNADKYATGVILVAMLLAVAGVSPVHAQSSARSTMLERMIAGVVTVAVHKSSPGRDISSLGVAGVREADAAYEGLPDASSWESSGSGFVIRHQGKLYVVTNAHVIWSASDEDASISVYSTTRTSYPVRVRRGDAFYDLAVLEFIDTPGAEIKPLAFRETSPRIGEVVFAVGNPLGKYPYSISDGIISGKNRFLGGLTGRYGYVQTTAGLIWGNSGGPLVAEDGKVVGVNTRIEITEGMGQAMVVSHINFALDGAIASRAVTHLLSAQGRIPRVFLGVELGEDTQVLTDRKGNPIAYQSARQVILQDVLPGTPAEAQLRGQIGTPLLRINREDITDMEAAITALEEAPAGKSLRLVFGGEAETVVEIQPDNMDDRAYETIARCYTRKYFDRDLVEMGGRVRAVKPGKGTNRMVNVRMYHFSADAEATMLDEKYPPAEFPIFGAGGEVSSLDDLWHIRGSADLGRSVRLGAIAGAVAVAVEEGFIGRCIVGIQSRDQSVIRSLLYY